MTRYAVSGHHGISAWLLFLLAMSAASIPVGHARADLGPTPSSPAEVLPHVTRVMTGPGVVFTLAFEQVVSHTQARVTLSQPDGIERAVGVRLMAQPNTLHIALGQLPSGEYRLNWQVRLLDGSQRRGTVQFSVG